MAPDLIERYDLAGAYVLGFIGSFYPYEGLDLLLTALARLRDKIEEIRMILVGGGPEEHRLRDLTERLGLCDVVIFTGRLRHVEVIRFYSVIDLLVYPRRSSRLTNELWPKVGDGLVRRRFAFA